MIRVEQKPLREYVFRPGQKLIPQTDVSTYDAFRYLCTPGFAALFLLLTFAGFSLFSRLGVILFLTEIMALVVLYLRTRLLARRISIKRVLPNRALREMEMVDVVVEIKNRSDLDASHIIVDDVFGLTKDPWVRVAPEKLGARSMARLVYRRPCDGGMGRQVVGPLTARVSDALGIFEFRIIEDTIHEIDVYPKVERIPTLAVWPSAESSRYGNYEVASRGLSVNFAGVRPYERGDSLRHIAWKISTRGQGLLVKEFEKVVSCDVSIVLNMAPHWQIGRHAASTWEYSKDISLAIVQQQLDLGNHVSFFSDRSFVEAGSGSDHFHRVAREVADLTPARDEVLIEPKPVLGLYRDFYVRGSNIFYITPFNLAEYSKSETWLKRLRAEGFHVTCVFIDTNSFWVQFIESISTGLLIGAKLMQGLDEIVEDLKKNGISVYVAENKMALRDVFRNKSSSVGRRVPEVGSSR